MSPDFFVTYVPDRSFYLNVSYRISISSTCRSALKTRAFRWCWSSKRLRPSQRTRSSGPPRIADGAASWFVSAANTLPPWFRNFSLIATKDACVLNPVVAPQFLWNTMIFFAWSGETNSANVSLPHILANVRYRKNPKPTTNTAVSVANTTIAFIVEGFIRLDNYLSMLTSIVLFAELLELPDSPAVIVTCQEFLLLCVFGKS